MLSRIGGLTGAEATGWMEWGVCVQAGVLTATLLAWEPLGWPSVIAKAELWSLKPKTRGTYCSGGLWGRTDG